MKILFVPDKQTELRYRGLQTPHHETFRDGVWRSNTVQQLEATQSRMTDFFFKLTVLLNRISQYFPYLRLPFVCMLYFVFDDSRLCQQHKTLCRHPPRMEQSSRKLSRAERSFWACNHRSVS
jgi:hypothetical protein